MSRAEVRAGPNRAAARGSTSRGKPRMSKAGPVIGNDDLARRHKTVLLYRNAVVALAVNLVIAALLVYVNSNLQVVSAAGLAWWCLLAAVAIGRYLLAWRFEQARPDAIAATRWRRWYIVSTGVLAAAWAGGAVLFMWNAPDGARLFTGLVLAGMVAGAVPILSPVWAAFLTFALLLCVPVRRRRAVR